MKILITGGKGYIAENIIRQYSNDVEFDISDYNVDLPLAHELNVYDILNKYKGIVHLAALSGIFACEENPEKAIQDNILAANNVFKIATKRNIPVVFTSSQAAKDPNSSIYAYMKWTCEKLASLYNDKGGQIYVLRLSNVYGGYSYLEKKQTCVKQFITRYIDKKPLIIHGDGKQTRDFIHVWDVCEAIMRCFAHKPIYKGPIDIGTGIGTSIIDLQKMFPIQEGQQKYKFEDGRNAGADSSIADISLAKKIMRFKAKRKLDCYIKEMI